ncbi:MAG: hypothetical protein AAGB19_07460 [Cyanobacteria bacterium P01_F01_bin.3]
MPDALDRLKNRKRPKVRERDTSLHSGSTDTQTSGHTDSETPKAAATDSRSQDIQKSRHTDPSAVVTEAPTPRELQTSLTPDISTQRHPEVKTSFRPQPEKLQVKRSTFRMEEGLTERLHSLCREQKISREVLMEAMFEYMEAHPDALSQVLRVAEEKNAYRQQIANRKRAEAMMQKFGK